MALFDWRRPVVTYRFGPFRVKDNESLWVNDTLVPLSPLQLRLLSYFCSYPQQVLAKERIIENVWGRTDVSDVSLARAIHGLRGRLATGSKASELIRNLYGRGYMLTQSVTVCDDRPAAVPDAVGPQGDVAAVASITPPRFAQDRRIASVASLQRVSLRVLS